MQRREFITLLGGAATLAPFAARAQQPAMPVIGYLRSTSLAVATNDIAAFRQGLKEAGFIEGQNVVVEYRAAENRADQLKALVAELIHRPAAVIVANGIAALELKAATKSIPIIFASGGDPVALGLVASLNRPGSNITGVNFFAGVLGTKRLEVIRQFLPKATTIGVLVHPKTTETEAERRDLQAAAQVVGQQILTVDASSDREIEAGFATFVQHGVGALIVGSGAFMNSHRERIVALAARHALPASFSQREAVVIGGLMSYGTNVPEAYRQAGIYAGRILKGDKPADLPVLQATKFELTINLKTAKTLGLEVPHRVLALADEVIE